MTAGIGANGIMGIAHETVVGTYVAPVKYIPFMSESLKYEQDNQWRRPIRQTAGITGDVLGNITISGDIEIEALPDCLPWFLHTSRASVVKTGAGPYTYTYTPTHNGVPTKTASITIVRNGIVFAYTGVCVSSYGFNVGDDGKMMTTFSLQALNEAVQSAPTPTWPTSVPPGAGMYSVEIPTASAVLDADQFEFSVNDNAEPQWRLKATGRTPQFIKYGEREVSLKTERDFDSRTEYDAFKSGTSQSITLSATIDASNSVTIVAATSIKSTYEVGLEGQGDLVRAAIEYQCVNNAGGTEFTLAVKAATENIT